MARPTTEKRARTAKGKAKASPEPGAKRLHLRLTRDEKRAFRAAAKKMDLPLAHWVRVSLAAAARRKAPASLVAA